MKPPIAVCVLKQMILVLIVHPHLFIFFTLRAHKIIGIDKIIPRIVRRVDVNHLHLAEIALLQNFQRSQIVALNIQVLGGVPVAAVGFDRAQCFGGGAGGFRHCCFFAHPAELIPFAAFHNIAAQQLAQLFKINALAQGAVLAAHLGHGGRKQRCQLFYIFGHTVRGRHFYFVHCSISCCNFLIFRRSSS